MPRRVCMGSIPAERVPLYADLQFWQMHQRLEQHLGDQPAPQPDQLNLNTASYKPKSQHHFKTSKTSPLHVRLGGTANSTCCIAKLLQATDHVAQRSTAQRSAAQHSAAQHSTAQRSTAQRSAAQHSTAQRSAAQRSTAQHSTAQDKFNQHKIHQGWQHHKPHVQHYSSNEHRS